MIPISQKYPHEIQNLLKNSRGASQINEENVLQEGNPANLEIVQSMVQDNLAPGSRVEGWPHLQELWHLSQSGKACLLLVEHYSNFDLPVLYALFSRLGPEGKAAADSILAIAGMKLNEDHPAVLAFAEAFSRIVIYPSRSLAAIKDSEALAAETQKSNRINMAAMKALTRAKHHSRLILVFPSGTRYRPGVEDTRRGLKEIDTYLKSFDFFVPIAINGNILRINTGGDMTVDVVGPDLCLVTVGPVRSTKEFRAQAQAECSPEGDVKQFTVDRVMGLLSELHQTAESQRRAEGFDENDWIKG